MAGSAIAVIVPAAVDEPTGAAWTTLGGGN
jgi:hypothetical protein